MIDRIIHFCLYNKLIVWLLLLIVLGWGIMAAPFDWESGYLPRDPVPVDAIPDIGENQQIVFARWPGRSPQDVEDQVSYPLTVSLLGMPGVKTVRSYAMPGFASIYVIFDETVDFYWSRSRVLEKLSSLPAGILPDGVQPALGPDATALGQVFWYTLEGRDAQGNVVGGWGLEELRSIQDWQVRYALLAAEGISEVASVGGYEKEYQIDVSPDLLRFYNVMLEDVVKAAASSNIDVGAGMMEVNRVEYIIRGLGFIKQVADIENTVVKVRDNVPVLIKDIASVSAGPAMRSGALDKNGAEAVGGVAVVRYGYNPLEAISNLKTKIAEVSAGLPEKVLADGTVSKVTVVPFYDRTGLIYETLGTLESALTQEILLTVAVVLVLAMNLRNSILISLMLPVTVLLCFIGMKLFKVDANIVALSGIAIAIGTIVDMGIIISENITAHMRTKQPHESTAEVIYRAASEVGSAVITAVATTVVGFLPVFTMTGAEGKLFGPLAWTKTFALVASVLVALTILPALAHVLHSRDKIGKVSAPAPRAFWFNAVVLLLVLILLTRNWLPLGLEKGLLLNLLFVVVISGALLGFFKLFELLYRSILLWCLEHKLLFLLLPVLLISAGGYIWSGLGKEFMPPLEEGSFLYMPTIMPHGSTGEALDVLQKQDAIFAAIPEVETVVGKIGRAESPLDPAPINMIETVINYKPEYGIDENGEKVRLWREHIKSPDDIWAEIARLGAIPGTTGAPKLQPIAARIVMLQSGMRAPMGIKVKGPDLETIESVSLQLESLLKDVPGVLPSAVIADRIVGKPYLEIELDREALARYGISIARAQEIIEVAIGGMPVTRTVEGRERYVVRVRYQRELRDSIESLREILISGSSGEQIPLGYLADIKYVRGPEMIKSEDTFLVGYVLFDKHPGFAEVDVVENCQQYLKDKIAAGDLVIPAGVSYVFAGTYENQLRAQKTLAVVIPLSLLIIFLILYMQFKSVMTSSLVFMGIVVAWSGGFVMIWLYSQSWYLDFGIPGLDLRELFQIAPINLSVAVWVGFMALFGIASDDGVVMCSYLEQVFKGKTFSDRAAVRDSVILAGRRRVRPCLMTTATTILALIPVLTSTGRGSDIMIPMAIPVFGGMIIEVLTMLTVPVLYSAVKEISIKKEAKK